MVNLGFYWVIAEDKYTVELTTTNPSFSFMIKKAHIASVSFWLLCHLHVFD